MDFHLDIPINRDCTPMLHIISKLDIKYIILKFIEIVFHFIIPNSPISKKCLNNLS